MQSMTVSELNCVSGGDLLPPDYVDAGLAHLAWVRYQ